MVSVRLSRFVPLSVWCLWVLPCWCWSSCLSSTCWLISSSAGACALCQPFCRLHSDYREKLGKLCSHYAPSLLQLLVTCFNLLSVSQSLSFSVFLSLAYFKKSRCSDAFVESHLVCCYRTFLKESAIPLVTGRLYKNQKLLLVRVSYLIVFSYPGLRLKGWRWKTIANMCNNRCHSDICFSYSPVTFFELCFSIQCLVQ